MNSLSMLQLMNLCGIAAMDVNVEAMATWVRQGDAGVDEVLAVCEVDAVVSEK